MGTFDGLHKGHQQIIDLLKAKSKEKNCPSVLLSFDPHPRMVLDQDKKVITTILSLEETIEILDQLGIDYFVIIPFTLDFAQLRLNWKTNYWLFTAIRKVAVVRTF